MQDEMMDLMDVSNEIQESLGRNYNVPDDIDEEELMGGNIIHPFIHKQRNNLVPNLAIKLRSPATLN